MYDPTVNPMLIDLCWREINAPASGAGQQLLRKIQDMPNLGLNYQVTGQSHEDMALIQTMAFRDLGDKIIDMLYGVKINDDGTKSPTSSPKPAVNLKDLAVQREVFVIAMIKAFKLGMYVQHKMISHSGALPEA